MPIDHAKLARMQKSVRTGGKGSVRRKKKAVHKTTTTDDKRLQNTLKRLGVNTIPGIEEVNLFKDNGSVIHFSNPKGARFGVLRCEPPRSLLRPAAAARAPPSVPPTPTPHPPTPNPRPPARCSRGPAPRILLTLPDLAVQASIAANTYVISGHAETKKLQDLLPGILNQLGPDNLQNLRKIAEGLGGPGDGGMAMGGDDVDDDDDDVPELVDTESFDQ